MIKRLRMKFICVNMAIAISMMLVIFGLVIHFTLENMWHQNMQIMEQAAQSVVLSGPPGEPPKPSILPGFVVELDYQGAVEVRGMGYYELSDESLVGELLERVRNTDEKTGILLKDRMQYLVHSTPIGQTIVFVEITSQLETMRELLKSSFLIGILSIGTFLAISFSFAHWAVQPVEKAWDQQKKFVADASHELKTPLTVIMTNAELLQDDSVPESERAHFLQNILTMTGQMRFLVEDLLDLARVDNGIATLDFSPVDFSELAEREVLLFEPVYFEQGLFLASDIAPGLRVWGSGAHLEQAMEVLLDNGLKYSTPGGTICMELKRQGKHCLLRVKSPGEEISKEDLKNIFKRFYRIDQARGRNGSSGLGLSIAGGIVKAHDGRIWAESADGINTFSVRLNLMPSEKKE